MANHGLDVVRDIFIGRDDGGAGLVGGQTSTSGLVSTPTEAAQGGGFVTFTNLEKPRVFEYRSDNLKDTLEYSVINDTLQLTEAIWLAKPNNSDSFKVVVSARFPNDGSGGENALVHFPFIDVDQARAIFSTEWASTNTSGQEYLAQDMRFQLSWSMNNRTGYSRSGLFSIIDPAKPDVGTESTVTNRLSREFENDPELGSVQHYDTEGGQAGSPTQSLGAGGAGSTNPSSTADSGQAAGGVGNKSHHKGGLSTGATAGIAVGAVIAGLLIIGALVFFLLRRRRQKKDLNSGYKGQQSSNTYMVDKETTGRVTESPTSPYTDDNQGQHVPLNDIEATREVPATHAPYEDAPPRSSLGSHGERGTGTQTPPGVSTNVAHLVEEGMTAAEIRRLEEEERQLDDEIERAARR